MATSTSLPPALVRAWRRASHRATRAEIPFTLTPHDLTVLWERCEGRCAASGLPFSDEAFQNALVKHPFAPSIDQIEATKGYTLENTRITCIAANFAMNQWGLDVLRRVARGVVKHEREERKGEADWYRRQREKLATAERTLESMKDTERIIQQHRIAGLKRALTMGPMKLSASAVKARKTVIRPLVKTAAAGARN